MSLDLSVRFKASRRPERILRLLIRAKIDVLRLKVFKVSSKVVITSAS